MQECIFCKIIQGEIPSLKIYEDNLFIAILDINPREKGHALIIPKRHCERLDELNDEESRALGMLLKHLAKEITHRLNATGYNVFCNNGESAGQVVKHLHFHILPRYGEKGHSLEVAFPVKEDVKNELESTANILQGIPLIEYKNTQEEKIRKEIKQQKKEKDKENEVDYMIEEIEYLPSD